jgi:hypothetical protein
MKSFSLLFSHYTKRHTLLAATLPLALFAPLAQAVSVDHTEFEATLQVPFRAAQPANEARSFTLNFDFPGAAQAQAVAWRVQLLDPHGKVVQSWSGIDALRNKALIKTVSWAGRRNGSTLVDGMYQVQMDAVSLPSTSTLLASTPELTVPALLGKPGADVTKQVWPMLIGKLPTPALPRFNALPTAGTATAAKANARNPQALVKAAATLPYTVYYGNLHSQTNHSDGGGDVNTCTHAQGAQTGAYGPADAYAYAKGKGLDFLMTSEHNHLADGNTSGVNAAADPAVAKARYQSGLTAASGFNSKNAGFLAMYGMEWGVISNGGHLNIFGSKELFTWEYNGTNQLIGDTFTAQRDYGALYSTMKAKNLIGQFNHPTSSGQFLIGTKALGYTADGDSVMALCEVANASAFSNTTNESDTNIDTFESACNKILENGYHVAFSSNQDNHCANWGASATNRTGVLIPTGTAFSEASFTEALRARRVFATMDKTSQLIFTANGHVMGERFNNTGPLTLSANFASSSGRTVASVALIEGVPGSSGSTALLADTATATITPTTGVHYYYAKVTQDDGKILWSAPIWVTQGSGGPVDSQAPGVSASVSGSSNTITLAANANDNVGVTKVEFYIDNVLKGSTTITPYTLAVNSTLLANGTHTLQTKAYDAANNVGVSPVINFTVSNGMGDLIVNGGFENKTTGWTAAPGIITTKAGQTPRTGTYKAWMNGYGTTHTDTLAQSVTLPAGISSAQLSIWLKIDSEETVTTVVKDTLTLRLKSGSKVLATLGTWSNLDKGSSFKNLNFDLTAYKGQTVQLEFEGIENSARQTSFVIDDVSLIAK